MTNTNVLTSKWAPPRLWLVPLIAALCYPLFLRSCYGSMQMFAASQTAFDRVASIVSFVASLAAAFAVPLSAARYAGHLARSSVSSTLEVRAYRFAHLAFAAPPLFTALGVITGILGIGTNIQGIGGLDFPIWILLWLGLGLYCARSETHETRIEAHPPSRGLVGFHGALALTVLLVFLIAHLVNHLFGLWSPSLHGRVMQVLERIYRGRVMEPMLVLCMLLLVVSGVTLAWRHTAIQGDVYRRVQTLTGVYLAAFILSHMTAVFVLARWLLHIATNDWAYPSGAPTGLLGDAWNVRLIPHYAIAAWAAVTHVGLGLRGVLRAHGVAERRANFQAKGMSAVGAIVSILITLGLIGVHLGGSVAMANGASATYPALPTDIKENYVPFCADANVDGPDADCVHALMIGPSHAQRILVLVPGASEGAESLRDVGRHISNALPDTQVWAFDRRQQNLVDSSRFGSDAESDYYLKGHYHQPTAENAGYPRDWGLAMVLSELRRVILAAGAGGRQVWLGGHSWGATTALAYAAWDFDGRPGFRDLTGLILIDGGAHGSFDGEDYSVAKLSSVQEAQTKLEAIKGGSPFSGDLGYVWQLPGAPESVPIYYQLAADYALRNPHGASSLQTSLPKSMQPPMPVTNAALLGWLLDTHAPAPDLKAHSGHIDTANVPVHDWIADGPADIGDLAAIFAHSRPAALEWYWPRRLSLDLTAIDPMADSPVTRALDLRLTHAADIDVPLYVFATGITHGTVVSSGQWVVAISKIRRVVYVTDDSMAHLDPLYDRPDHNKFLQTLVKFLQESPAAGKDVRSGS
jgi:hypothetical protein